MKTVQVHLIIWTTLPYLVLAKTSSFNRDLKDVREWQFLTMKAAETLCIVYLPPEKR